MGAVTLIQRFGSALKLNVHLHMLFLDGVYGRTAEGLTSRRVSASTPGQLQALLDKLNQRLDRYLERHG
jgi:hypothetical protein